MRRCRGDQGVELRRQPGDHAGGERHDLVHVLVGDDEWRVTLVRLATGEQFEQQDSGRVDVRPGVGGARDDLLGCDIADGPDQHPGLRLLARALGAGQTEVGDLDLPVVGEQDVLRLHVAMDQAGPVGRAERREDRLHGLQRRPGAERPAR